MVWFPAFARHARGLHLSPQGSALTRAPVGVWPSDRSGRTGSSAADRGTPEGADLRHSLAGSPAGGYRAASPELQIALTTTTEHSVNFRTEPYDAAIVFGTHHSVGDLLFEEALTPVCNGILTGTTC